MRDILADPPTPKHWIAVDPFFEDCLQTPAVGASMRGEVFPSKAK